jgi:hypothetical protein
LKILIIASYQIGCLLAVYQSFITPDNLHEAIDLTNYKIKLANDEFIEGQISYSQLNSVLLRSPLNSTHKWLYKRLNPKKPRGFLIITNKRAFFTRKKGLKSCYEINLKDSIPFPDKIQNFEEAISSAKTVNFSNACTNKHKQTKPFVGRNYCCDFKGCTASVRNDLFNEIYSYLQ